MPGDGYKLIKLIFMLYDSALKKLTAQAWCKTALCEAIFFVKLKSARTKP